MQPWLPIQSQRPSPDRPMTAALATLMLVLAMVVGLSVSLAPTARAALVTLATSDRALDMTVDETDTSSAWVRPVVSTKLPRQISATDGPPQDTSPLALALLPVDGNRGFTDRPVVHSLDRDVFHPAANGHLTGRSPTGPPAPESRAF
ncbi:hypothetical protein [Magnetospirillum molischianum]|uniref:Uncharacterized protein n=1 Tax=Magnetospirillum molischianum DSM 120 TaxID=1150626 RepID=H8FUE1_MAGML|nr:hypothetical protein [Magnetospirillum molischianum]CCG41979.1 exported hypothetical protein [Magnetospirillum molischianum DSM 120]